MQRVCRLTISGLSIKQDFNAARRRLMDDFPTIAEVIATTAPETVLVVASDPVDIDGWCEALHSVGTAEARGGRFRLSARTRRHGDPELPGRPAPATDSDHLTQVPETKEPRMKPRRLLSSSIAVALLVVIILVLALSGGGSAATAPSAASHAANELTTRATAVGQILVDGRGRSLYLFAGDKPNRSTLSRAGLKVWPAFAAGHLPLAAGGVGAAHISLIHANGIRQLAYFGHPLYHFIRDGTAGATSGQGLREFGALWYTISASGKADMQARPAAPAAAPAPTTGYGY
jgi:predicted lipoprotein with Yx(FWY)xxD motif